MASSSPPGFFQRRPLRRALRNWLERHRHPFNFWIHLVGIPLAFAGIALFLFAPWSYWPWALAAFVGGYALQYVGHRVEGNDLGEWAAIKRMLGLPYVGVAPQWETMKNEERRMKYTISPILHSSFFVLHLYAASIRRIDQRG